MNSRYLPAVVFVLCVLAGFGVGLEAEGQSRTNIDWTTPEWQLPWGMSWPEPAPEPVEAVVTDALNLDEDAQSGDAPAQEGGNLGDVGPSAEAPSAALPGSAVAPGIFPGLVNPPKTDEAEVNPEVVEAQEGQGSAPTSAEVTPANEATALNAQLAQLQILDEQLKAMSDASQNARQAMEAALNGRAPEPEVEEVQATPEQIEQSLVLLTDMVKKMKPAKAAEILAQWDESLAIGILRRLGSRRATPVLSKMPVTLSGRLTSRIAMGVGALPPVSAEGAEASPQGGVE